MSNSLTIIGTIIGTIKTIGNVEENNGFTKRYVVIETKNGSYTDTVAIQFVKDRTDLLDKFSVGQEVRIHFNLRSREYNGKYYSDITGWGIALNTAQAANYSQNAQDTQPGLVTNAPSQPAVVPNGQPSQDPTSDLPF